jgi:hypothetical protein
MSKKHRDSYLVKSMIVGLLVAAGVFFGIDIATSGLQRVQGNHENVAGAIVPSVTQATAVQTVPADKPESLSAAAAPEAEYSSTQNMSLINRFAIKLGEALQWGAKELIRVAVNLFNSIIF